MAALGAALAGSGCGGPIPAAQAQAKTARQSNAPQIPLGAAGEKIRLGQRIFERTPAMPPRMSAIR